MKGRNDIRVVLDRWSGEAAANPAVAPAMRTRMLATLNAYIAALQT
jgi:hypothetical protein